jgi:NADH-quinone oxidoreductase subunit B
VATERRPLSWTVGPQGIIKPDRPSRRDLLQPERSAAGVLESPDGV